MTFSLEKIAELIGATLIGDSATEIYGISTLTDANVNQISYAVSDKYINSLSNTKAGAVILPKKLKEHCPTNALIVDDAYLAFAKITHQFKHYNFPVNNSSSNAIIDSSVSIATVYRTVRLFEEAGILDRHDFGDGRARYEEATYEHHDHLINIKSGAVIEFTNDEIEAIQERIAREHGLRLVDHRHELYGVPIEEA